MELQTLKATTRDEVGKGCVGRLRKTGQVPCILYGGGGEPANLKFGMREFIKLIKVHHSENLVLQVEVEDKAELSCPVMVKTIDHHPLKGAIMHADMIRISLDERLVVPVTVRLVGQSPGVIEGGVLDQQLRDIEIECLALEIPEAIEADISGLDIDMGLHVSDLTAPEGVTIVTDAKRSVVAVHAPRVVVEETEVEDEEGVEGEGEEGEGTDETEDKEETAKE